MPTTNISWLLRPLPLAMLTVLSCCAISAVAQDEVSPQADTDTNPAETLSEKQERVAAQYKRLEELLLKRADFEANTNPTRAKLLREAFATGREKHIQMQLNSLVKLLDQEQFKRAIDNQAAVKGDLKALLDLLQKEDSGRRGIDQQRRIKDYIRELDRLIRKQRGTQGRTEGGAKTAEVAKEQDALADRTGDLAEKIRENEEDGQSKDGDAKDGESGEPKDGQGEPNDGESSDGQSKDGEPMDGQSQDGQPQEGEPKDGQPMDGQPQQGQPQPNQPPEGGKQGDQPQQQQDNPARKRIEQARQKMQEAQEKLEKAERENAVKDQEEARRLLEQAKAELEEILRQLREEEVERMLALLETRFRKMLKMQTKVNESTTRLDKDLKAGDDPAVEARAGKLAFEEKKIILEIDKAIVLLKEEGSSIAFPEVAQQLRSDMVQVAGRLAEVRTGTITQAIEQDIVDTLTEMIEALQQAQKDLEDQKDQPPPMGQGQPGEAGLVDMIAELKMIRALQARVKRRTDTYAESLTNPADLIGQATEDELKQAIVNLSQRQAQCQRITREIVLGKNQ